MKHIDKISNPEDYKLSLSTQENAVIIFSDIMILWTEDMINIQDILDITSFRF